MQHPSESLIRGLAKLLQDLGQASEDLTELRQELLRETGAWAVGVWRVRGASLEQVLFAAAKGFDPLVAREFEAATRDVPLDRTQLGIVNAVVHQRPARALAMDQAGELRQSAGWLERFGAKCSLSCPLRDSENRIVGVIAVSWRELVIESDEAYLQLLTLADAISRN